VARLCPFEQTPSFTAVDAKGCYHCFGCGAHGDIFDWLRLQRAMSLTEAVAYLTLPSGAETSPLSFIKMHLSRSWPAPFNLKLHCAFEEKES
jgi:DNA primase